MHKSLLSTDIIKWPEWEAFRKRLGIPKQPDKIITIRLDFRDGVKITQEYVGQNKGRDFLSDAS
jgi:hypothetical protein